MDGPGHASTPHAGGGRVGRNATWPSGRSLHGGVDEVPLPEVVPGRLWLCGKRFVGPDPDAALAEVGATTVVCLCEPPELDERYPAYVEWLRSNEPRRALWRPVPDLHAPSLDDALELCGDLLRRLDDAETILLHCGAGIGRAGTVAAALLTMLGEQPADAVAHVRAHRPMAGPEVGAQAELLDAIAARRATIGQRAIPGASSHL